MFILRFIGRILSIGFILFIVFIITGKNSRADGMRMVSEPSVQYRVVHEVGMFALAVRPSSLRR